jgi:hypothetical protein
MSFPKIPLKLSFRQVVSRNPVPCEKALDSRSIPKAFEINRFWIPDQVRNDVTVIYNVRLIITFVKIKSNVVMRIRL